MKRILVTGGAGFIGSNFIHYILTSHPDVHIINLDKLTYAGNPENLESVNQHPRYKFVQGDIADRSLVSKLVEQEKFHAIVNFAAETHVDRSIHRPADFLQTDIFGTFSLLEAARQHGVERFLQVSTDEVYGSILEGHATENYPLHPSSPYSASKGGADLLCQSYYTTYGLHTIITRAANNYGPYQYPEKLIPLFVTNALDDLPLPLYGDGSQRREWLYVMDHCRALDLALHQGKAGEIYNICGFCEENNRTIADHILRILKKSPQLIRHVKDRPGHDLRYAIDSSKIQQLGWKPDVALEDGLYWTIDWYKKNREWWEKIKNTDYKKYYQQQYGEQVAAVAS